MVGLTIATVDSKKMLCGSRKPGSSIFEQNFKSGAKVKILWNGGTSLVSYFKGNNDRSFASFSSLGIHHGDGIMTKSVFRATNEMGQGLPFPEHLPAFGVVNCCSRVNKAEQQKSFNEQKPPFLEI